MRRVAWIGCTLLLPCSVEVAAGTISALSPQQYEDFVTSQMLDFVNPLAVGGRIVTYGGKHFLSESLEKVLARGRAYAMDAAGYLVERLPGAIREYDIIRYGAQALRSGSNMDAHHGVMNSWFEGINFPGYNRYDAPAIMLHPTDHARATAAFNEWAVERFGNTRNIDWTSVTQDEMMVLAQELFAAAGVAEDVQTNYFAILFYYLESLGD
jgi:hypothetical protein